tara:strand:- start:115 stop:315 length:201 start_codon:yes stop_codon:yes gene_type:complete
MKFTNKQLNLNSKTFETRLLQAVWNDNNKQIQKLILEAEELYKNGYLTKEEYNTMTDIELIKEIYS